MTCAGPGVAEVSADVCNEENYERKRETWRIIREVYAHTTSYIKELSILLNIITFFCSFSLKKRVITDTENSSRVNKRNLKPLWRHVLKAERSRLLNL